MKNIITFGLLGLVILGIGHAIYWVIVKCVIFLASSLFGIDWGDKFWNVYLLCFIVFILFGRVITGSKK